MRRWSVPLLLVLLLVSLMIPGKAYSQEEIQLSSMKVALWPEYDQPSVLVIYYIVLPAEITLPVDLTFRIPASVGEPNAVAAKQMDGSLFNVVYERQVIGDWAYISFTATTPESQLEYYDPTLVVSGEDRHYEYLWPGDYPVDAMFVQVQQPLGAEDMRISPSMGSGTVGSDGLTYYNAEIGALTQDQTFEISIDYQKSTNTLSVESVPIAPSAPIPDTGPENINWTQLLPWLLGVLGVGLIAGGIWWYWSTGKRQPASHRQPVAGTRREPESSPVQGDVFCHQCGRRAGEGDIFCRSCGTRLRVG